MRSFLGACNVYRRFVPGMAKLAKPLNDMLKKGAEPDFSEPTVVQSEAFESLKAALVSPPVLALPRAGCSYIIDTDASLYQLGAVLLQVQDGEPRTIGYWSRGLNPAVRNYSATERECLSVV